MGQNFSFRMGVIAGGFVSTALELNSDVMSMMPQLANDNFAIAHAPNVAYGRFLAPTEPKYDTIWDAQYPPRNKFLCVWRKSTGFLFP